MALATLVSQNVQRFIAKQMDDHLAVDVCEHWMDRGMVPVPDVIDMVGYVTRQLKAQWLFQWPKSEEFKMLYDIDIKKHEKIKEQNQKLKKEVRRLTEENEKLKKDAQEEKEENEKLKKEGGVQKIKKPKTAWIVYQTTERDVLKNENPEMANRLILKELGKRWKKLKADAKAGDQAAKDTMARIETDVAADRDRYTTQTAASGVSREPTKQPRRKSMYQSWCAKYRPVFKEQGLAGAQLREAISAGWKKWKQNAKEGKCADEEAAFRDVKTDVSQTNNTKLFKKIRVAQLREQLKKRNMDATGKKAVLVQRLVDINIFPPFAEPEASPVAEAVVSVTVTQYDPNLLGFEPEFTEHDITSALREIIRENDWDNLTKKSVRSKLENKLGLAPKELKGIKKWINEKSVSIAEEEYGPAAEQAEEAEEDDVVTTMEQNDEKEMAAYDALQVQMEQEAKAVLRENRTLTFAKKRGVRIECRQDVIDLTVDECREELERRKMATEGTDKEVKMQLAKVTGFLTADQTKWASQIKFDDASFTDWSLSEDTLTEEICHKVWDELSPNVKYFRPPWIWRELNIATKLPQVYLCLIYSKKIHKWMQNWYKIEENRVQVTPDTPRRMRWRREEATLKWRPTEEERRNF